MASESIRETSAAMRWLGVPFTVLAGLGGLQLYVFPQDTDRFFAWTLGPQQSAMFMGAGFAAGVVLTVLSFRRQPWVFARTAAITIFVFVAVMTVATVVHIDLLHLDSDVATASLAAWVWLVVYTVLAPVLGIMIYVESKRPGTDPAPSAPLPPGLRAALAAEGGLMVIAGAVLFMAPATITKVWPWAVTPFAGRAVASWAIAIGVAALWATVENDLRRARPAAITFTLVAALWLLAILRGSADILWERPAAWIYLVFVVAAVGTGAWGWALTQRSQDPEPSR